MNVKNITFVNWIQFTSMDYGNRTHVILMLTWKIHKDIPYHILGHRHTLTNLKQQKSYNEPPCWYSGEEPMCHCRGHRFDLRSGKIPHATERLSPCTTWACALQPVLLNKGSHLREKPVHHKWRGTPVCHNGRKAHTARKAQHSQK